MFKQILLPLILMLVLTACQSNAATNNTQPTSILPTNTPLPPTQPVPTIIPPTPTPVATQPEPTPTHIRVDLTPAQLAAISALPQDKGIPVDQIQLVSTEAATWENGCLGIVIPGVLCTQGLVDGFNITLSAAGNTYEYHTNQDGTSVLLVTTPFLSIAVRLPDNSVQIVPLNLLNSRGANLAVQSFIPLGGAVGGSVYALVNGAPFLAVAVDTSGSRGLDFIKNPNYGLAVWPGDANSAPRLAWGTQLDFTTMQTSLMVSAPDGTQLEILHTEQADNSTHFQLVALRWSADGKSLYYSKEPYGIGGYILYNGASSLYRIDLATQQITEIIPADFQKTGLLCLDTLSPDYSLVADHCIPNVITVRNLDTGHTVTIQPPTGVTGFGSLGSARFSPDGTRLAFALSKGDPNAE